MLFRSKTGKTRYLSSLKDILRGWKYEVEVFITGESFNKAVVVGQLNDLLLNYSKLPGINIDIDAVFKEILDLMGLGGARFQSKSQTIPKVVPAETAQTALTNTLQGSGKL